MAKITKKYYADRKSPFALSWYSEGKRISRFFDTEEARDIFINTHSFLEEKSFESLMAMERSTIADVALIESKRGEVSFREIWEFWQKNHQQVEMISLWNACHLYVNEVLANSSLEHTKHVRKILENLCNVIGDKLVSSITRAELETFLRELPFSPVTKNNYRSSIRAAWGFFERNNYIEKNIAIALSCPKIEKEEIAFLSVEDTEKLLRANEDVDPEICGLLALGLFAGMRSSAIPRVDYKEITFGKGIETPAHKTKKGRRNYIENLPDNLWAWLERTPETAFSWCERKWKRRREFAFRRAGLLCNCHDIKRLKAKGIDAELKLPVRNALRHSFATYHVAWKRDFQDTALIMSHKGTAILFDHYRGNATEENAKRYFNIYPKSLLSPSLEPRRSRKRVLRSSKAKELV